jgi:hypothetical protein
VTWDAVSSHPLKLPAGRDVKAAWKVSSTQGGQKTLTIVLQVDEQDDAFPDECRTAIATEGRSAVAAYADQEWLPQRFLVTTTGLVPEYD